MRGAGLPAKPALVGPVVLVCGFAARFAAWATWEEDVPDGEEPFVEVPRAAARDKDPQPQNRGPGGASQPREEARRPSAPSPSPEPSQGGTLFGSGDPTGGSPVPKVPGGGCPGEFHVEGRGVYYAAGAARWR